MNPELLQLLAKTQVMDATLLQLITTLISTGKYHGPCSPPFDARNVVQDALEVLNQCVTQRNLAKTR